MRLTSTRNPAVQLLRSLEKSSARREHQLYLAEGVRLIGEAIETGQKASLALYDPELLNRSAAGTEILFRIPEWAERSFEADERLLRAAAQTETPAGVVAALRPPVHPPLRERSIDGFGLVLDSLSDPGNAGTILRAAGAFGVDYIASVGGVDLFSPKVVRAGMGAHFRLPLYQDLAWDELQTQLKGVDLVAAAARQGLPVAGFEWPDAAALVIGSEGAGLSPSARKSIQQYVHIPMKSGVESLNAAVAASILLYTRFASIQNP